MTAPDGYRHRTLASFFESGPSVIDLVNPVAGPLSPTIDVDLRSPVTAKASGFMVRRTKYGSYVQPWGGHEDRYRAAVLLGLLEGVERQGAAAPAPGYVLTNPPASLRRIELGSFGVLPSGWSTPNPEVLSWSPAVVLSTGEQVVIPTRISHYAADLPDAPFAQESSNGCALGGTDTEAQLFGLLETIERDAFLIAWYGGLGLPEIDPQSILGLSVTSAFWQRMTLAGQRVRFFDATVGIPVPTVIAVAESIDGVTCVGAGAHPDPTRALHSALIEVASDFQVVRSHLEQRGQELARMVDDFSRVRVMEDHADMFAHPRARPFLSHWLDRTDTDMVSLDKLRRHPDGGLSVESDLTIVLSEVEKAGFEAVAVSTATTLSRELEAACWRVLVPGLIPIDFGWAHQRALHMPRLAEMNRRANSGSSIDFQPHLVPHPFP